MFYYRTYVIFKTQFLKTYLNISILTHKLISARTLEAITDSGGLEL